MNEIIEWIINNKLSLLSGSGGLVIVWILGVIFKRRTGSSQKIRSGSNSRNYQAGGDLTTNNDPESSEDGK